MDTQHWLYRLSRAYLIGVGIGGAILSLTLLPPLLQGATGLAAGIVGWTWYKNVLESNK